MAGLGTVLTFEDTDEIEDGKKPSSTEDQPIEAEYEESKMEDYSDYGDGDTQEPKEDKGSEGSKSMFM